MHWMNKPKPKMKPYPHYKDSGIAWLGQIPEHWEIKKLKFLSEDVCTGGTPSSLGKDYFGLGTINWFTPGDFKDNGLLLEESSRKVSEDVFTDKVIKKYPGNSVLIVGIGATLGKIAITKSDFSANQQINIIIPKPSVDPEFLAFFLLSQQNTIKVLSSSTTLGIIIKKKPRQYQLTFPHSPSSKRLPVSWMRRPSR